MPLAEGGPAAAPPARALRWDGARLELLDQTRLPDREIWLTPAGAEEVAVAIERLAVRGAPNIGIAAAYGLAMEVTATPGLGTLEAAWERLRTSRPTAVNLGWAVDRVRAAALAAGPARMAAAAREQAQAIHAWEDEASALLCAAGAGLLRDLVPAREPVRVLTHCNTGALATGGTGSALGVIAELARHRAVEVLACETRPLLQGARLTAWELGRLGIPHALLVDGAAAGLIARGEVDAVIVGCDRVAANGDTANKVGTYAHALAAGAAGIPFLVAGPTSSIDPHIAHGDDIAIEERDAREVTHVAGSPTAPLGTQARNPAFDVTPARLITALVTERGVARPVEPRTVGALVPVAEPVA
ncbi:S-methyl-5-thioribose-1-phosphate isomerase [Paraconexibacter sp.]|uniref:S-methyl-5-thioribose-1-phosphate isomerase n=1 Tax=Paraconexibacter sp. TaxID=2949640 RepID=UPI0035691371